jgi:hypothetical protein
MQSVAITPIALSDIMPSVAMLSIAMLSIIMLSVIMLSVIMLSVAMLSGQLSICSVSICQVSICQVSICQVSICQVSRGQEKQFSKCFFFLQKCCSHCFLFLICSQCHFCAAKEQSLKLFYSRYKKAWPGYTHCACLDKCCKPRRACACTLPGNP